MGTSNLFLPDALEAFVDDQVERLGFGTRSEYIREVLRMEQDRQRLRGWLQRGSDTAVTLTAPESANYEALRHRVLTGTRR